MCFWPYGMLYHANCQLKVQLEIWISTLRSSTSGFHTDAFSGHTDYELWAFYSFIKNCLPEFHHFLAVVVRTPTRVHTSSRQSAMVNATMRSSCCLRNEKKTKLMRSNWFYLFWNLCKYQNHSQTIIINFICMRWRYKRHTPRYAKEENI